MSVPNLEKQIGQDQRIDGILSSVKDIRRRIEEALSRLGGSDSPRSAMTTLGHVADLENQLSSGGVQASDIPNIARLVASIQAFAETIEQVASANQSTKSDEGLAALAATSREQASRFMRDLRQYDNLLQFQNDADSDAYNQREEERRKRYEAEAAKGTPEGTLNANGAALGQMADLAAHGGSADPALLRRMDELAASTAALREKIMQEGGDVSKFDEGLRTDLRAIMKSKGIPDEKIEALLAEHSDDPIDALKAFVAQHHDALAEHDVDDLKNKIRDGVFDADHYPQAAQKAQTSAVPLDTMTSAFAKLKASGVTMETGATEVQPGHEVTAQTLPGVRQGILLS